MDPVGSQLARYLVPRERAEPGLPEPSSLVLLMPVFAIVTVLRDRKLMPSVPTPAMVVPAIETVLR